jgi:ferredoxin
LLLTYRQAGGRNAVVLMHDGRHGDLLIAALARHGEGLPANVLPLRLNEFTQVGLEAIVAAFAYGAAAVRILGPARSSHDLTGLHRTLEIASAILPCMGYLPDAAALIAVDEPDALVQTLAGTPADIGVKKPSSFLPVGQKRELTLFALRQLQEVAPVPADTIALPAHAGFGRVVVETEGCTLCLACVSACPTQALADNLGRPMLRFNESLCVQCGLCAQTCPEKVISLEPRLAFDAYSRPPVVLKEEDPFCCTVCGKPFGTRSAIERVIAKLEGRHWMFSDEGAERLSLLKMCEDCRIAAVANAELDPYAAPPRPAPKTSGDYLAERDKAFLDKIDKGDA